MPHAAVAVGQAAPRHSGAEVDDGGGVPSTSSGDLPAGKGKRKGLAGTMSGGQTPDKG